MDASGDIDMTVSSDEDFDDTSAEALEALALCAAAKCLGLEPDIDVLLDSGAPPPLTRRRCKLHWDILEETLEDPPEAACAEEWRNFVYRAVAHIVNLPDWALWALPPSDTPLSIPSPSVRASAAHVSGAVSPLAQRDADGCPPTGGHAYAEAMSLPPPAPAADVPMLDVGMDVEMDMMMEAISDIDEDEDDALIEWVPEEEWPRTHTAEDHKFLEMLASCPTVLYPESWDGDDMQEHTMALVESPPGASLEPKTPNQMAHWSPCLRGVGLADAWSFSGGQLL